MKKKFQLLVLALVLFASLVFAAPAHPVLAADLSNGSGQSCGDFIGTWHFVNNQTGGAPAGELYVSFSSGDQGPIAPSKITSKNQHFYVSATGTLIGAFTNLPGRLVLSDFTCGDEKKPEPPKK